MYFPVTGMGKLLRKTQICMHPKVCTDTRMDTIFPTGLHHAEQCGHYTSRWSP